MKKWLSALLILALLAAVPALAEGEKVVNVGVTSTLTTLNPLAMDNTEIVKYAASLVFLPLVELNADLEFVPQLADPGWRLSHLSTSRRPGRQQPPRR